MDDKERVVEELSRIRELLVRFAGNAGPSASDNGRPVESYSCALDHLAQAAGLTPFERDVLLLCAGIELESDFERLCGEALGLPDRAQPTFSLALAAFPGAHWSAVSADRPLRRWGLIEVAPGSGITTAPLRIDERILSFLLGVPHSEPRLAGVVQPVEAPAALAPSQERIGFQIRHAWAEQNSHHSPAVQLCGPDAGVQRMIAARAAEIAGANLIAVPARSLPSAPGELDRVIRLIERECFLHRAVVLLECDARDAEDAEREHIVTRFIASAQICLAIAGPRRRPDLRAMPAFEVRKPDLLEQRSVWVEALRESGLGQEDGLANTLAAQFHLHVWDIRNLCREVRAHAGAMDDARSLQQALWDACRSYARPKMGEFAQRLALNGRSGRLVLPEAQSAILREMVLQVRHGATVYQDWGFGREERGSGVSALFSGPSGTGKTLAAEHLAHELRLDLYRVDLSAVVSKYIGETEKNLRQVFDAAEESACILLFDEADALFGKRSEVKDSHDRYANIEVSYLLQRMETFRGISVLTTNLPESLDPAFLRRLRFTVQFPFPDAALRAEIWRGIFPRETPTEGLDPIRLGRLSVAGGNIRSIALRAAFLAADAGEPVRFSHILKAVSAEFAKLQRPLPEAEIRGWV